MYVCAVKTGVSVGRTVHPLARVLWRVSPKGPGPDRPFPCLVSAS